MWAAYKGRTDVARLLLEKGANPNITGQVLRLETLYFFFFFPHNNSIIGICYSLIIKQKPQIIGMYTAHDTFSWSGKGTALLKLNLISEKVCEWVSLF